MFAELLLAVVASHAPAAEPAPILEPTVVAAVPVAGGALVLLADGSTRVALLDHPDSWRSITLRCPAYGMDGPPGDRAGTTLVYTYEPVAGGEMKVSTDCGLYRSFKACATAHRDAIQVIIKLFPKKEQTTRLHVLPGTLRWRRAA